jgi:hypothetical protein
VLLGLSIVELAESPDLLPVVATWIYEEWWSETPGSSVLQSRPIALAAGIIWCTHIGLDRALGYGLKYSTGFQYTHLGRIGRRPQSMSPSPTGGAPGPK